MTKEEEKLIGLYEFFLNEKLENAIKFKHTATSESEKNFRIGQQQAFKEMLSFTENLKRTL